jgi:surface polysaccharide O-acyltransferase-like enzyme
VAEESREREEEVEVIIVTLLLLLISMIFTEIVVTYTMSGDDYRFKKNIYRLSLITLGGMGVIVLWLITRN